MKLVRIGVTALLLCMVFACNNASKKEMAAADIAQLSQKIDKEIATYKEEQPAPPPGGNKQQQNPQQPNSTTVNMDWEKKIIKNADLHLEVTD